MKLLIIYLLSIYGLYAQDITVTTFNVGLAHTYVPYAAQRLPFIIEELIKDDSDILCLQEVWLKNDSEKIIKQLTKHFPYHYRRPITNLYSSHSPTCTPWDLFGEQKFLGCLSEKCSDKKGDDFTDCILKNCEFTLKELKTKKKECANALMAQVGKSTLKAFFTLINPFSGANLYVYEGSDGLLLLAKYPLENKSYLSFEKQSTLIRRGALKATMKHPEGNINILCTHLTADLSNSTPYTGQYESWGEENLIQAKLLIEDAKKSTLPTVILGDLNTSPEIKERAIFSELPHTYKFFEKSEFMNNLMLNKNIDCTYCKTNHLNKNSSKSYILDHIFFKGLDLKEARIKYSKEITLKNNKMRSNLSDHFAVESILNLR